MAGLFIRRANDPTRSLDMPISRSQKAKSVNHTHPICQTVPLPGKIIIRISSTSEFQEAMSLTLSYSSKLNSTTRAPKLTSETLSKIPNGPDNQSNYVSRDESHERMSLGLATNRSRDSRAQELEAWEVHFQSLGAGRWGRNGRQDNRTGGK